MAETNPILSLRNLSIEIRNVERLGRPVDDVSYDLAANETLGIVGESGSGKSIHVLAMLGLLPRAAKVASGTAMFRDVDLLKLSAQQRRAILGRHIGMVFQDPMTSLNPVLTIGVQITEVLREHLSMSRSAARRRALELLELVEIREPQLRLDQYPHELSGGMRQRVMIAIAIACEPSLLIADEATTALDVTVQSQIVETVMNLKARLGMAVIWISHDMGIIARVSDTVQVMYGGQILERGPVRSIFEAPQNAYTWSLLKSIPRSDQVNHESLYQIEGTPPDLFNPCPGDPFAPRNPFVTPRCFKERPTLREVAGRPGHHVAAWYDLPAELARQETAR